MITRATVPARLREAAVLPGDAAYERVRHTYSYRGSPALVLRPGSTEEVADAMRFAGATGLDLAVRSGGHGISGRATNDDGIVLDLGRLDAVEVLGDRDVRLGPGAVWGDVAAALVPHGLAISSGDSGDVGVGGLATTGGLGLLARATGLTVDHVEAASLVTADGTVVRTDADHEPDLFWAVRGAGANVGVVTELRLRADAVRAVVHGELAYAVDDPAAFLVRWSEVVQAAPREVTAFVYLFPQPGGGAQAMANLVVRSDDRDVGEELLAPFATVGRLVGGRASLTTYDAVPQTTHAPLVAQAPWPTRSVLTGAIGPDLAERLAAVLGGGAAHTVQLRAVGGAVNDVAADATAYAHRHQLFCVMAAGDPASVEALDAAWRPVRALGDGLYLSFDNSGDPSLVEDAFPGPTLVRLRELKRAWDPDNLFRRNFSVA